PARVRRRGPLAPGPARAALRRGAYVLVSVFLAARRGPGRAGPSLPHRRGLVRGLEPGLLAAVPWPARGPGRVVGAEAVRTGAPASVLLLAAVRAPSARRGPARRDHHAGRRLSGSGDPAADP